MSEDDGSLAVETVEGPPESKSNGEPVVRAEGVWNAESGSPAYDVLKKMKITNDDQDPVAKAIAGDKEDPEKAGQDWVEENADKVNAWLN
jgi:ABC-type proline/glycine betaine transport system substrate-binding protein